ncbi:hypothetical protein JRO89_XS04G0076200 [Xanthoceras sorbifolium]|uniref:Maltose excess protein 1, chloroplastic-like n=1 Tax=Xanthoceras sorbifolium TaxID=99658 RepID=A0ABQ8I4I2_9ROSI|nr:hypothetical protein JRO89_XS04G0076200 [Xanthoceras sorbifolium]
MAKALVVPLARKAPSNDRFIYPKFPVYASHSLSFENKPIKNLNNVLFVSHYTLASLHRRLTPVLALDSDVPHPLHQGSADIRSNKSFEQWNSLTAKFSGASNIPFTLLQLPQIILNARNLLAGNKTALLAVPWLVRKWRHHRFTGLFMLLVGMFTGLLGNLSLLSYFAKKKEKEAIVVQTLGVVSIYAIIVQLAMAEAMPLPIFVITSVVVASGLVLNFLNYFNWLNARIWQFWEDFITVGGITVLPQVSSLSLSLSLSLPPCNVVYICTIYTKQYPARDNSLCCRYDSCCYAEARIGRLPEKGVKFVGAISGWTATLLFMWMPVSQMWTNFLNPDNIKGLSAVSMLLAMIGNGLMIPRALFIRDFMWFTGSTWAALFYGYGNIVCLYWFKVISREFFLAATIGLFSWIGPLSLSLSLSRMTLWRDTVVYGYSSPLRSLRELVFGN